MGVYAGLVYLDHPRLRHRGAGGVRRGLARDAGDLPAGARHRLRRRAHRRPELRRAARRARARDLPRGGPRELRGHGRADAGSASGRPSRWCTSSRRMRRWSRSPPSTSTSSRGTSWAWGSCSPARASSRRWATRGPRSSSSAMRARHLRGAGAVALDAAGVPSPGRLAPLRRDGGAAGRGESRAAAVAVALAAARLRPRGQRRVSGPSGRPRPGRGPRASRRTRGTRAANCAA